MKPETVDNGHAKQMNSSKHLHKTQIKIEKVKKTRITGKDALTRITGKDALTRITGKDALTRITEKDALTRITGKDALTRITGKDALTRITGKDALTRITGKDALTRITGKDALTRITGKDALTRITGKDARVKEMCIETLQTKTDDGEDVESSGKRRACDLVKLGKANESRPDYSSGLCNSDQSSSKKTEQAKKFPDKRLFPFGNYDRYYGYRNPANEDYRLYSLNRSWFQDKEVLDIGCNTGQFTLQVAKRFRPKKIVAVDIDKKLIRIARKNIWHYVQLSKNTSSFPVSFRIAYGCTGAPVVPGLMNEFPNNVIFIECNYVLDSDTLLELQKPEYDTILFLSTSKWIHLNWGDAGLQRVFKRIYAQLRPGGRMIFEPQPWDSYSKSKKINETLRQNYYSINMKPESFCDYLLSKDVGFETCEMLDTPPNTSKGFQRPIYLLTKRASDSNGGQSSEGASSVSML